MVTLTIERLEDGEVSPYLTDVVQPGDQLELRGPVGGYFTWTVADGGPLLLVGGGSGIVPLMAMIRHRAAQHSDVACRLLFSARSDAELIYRRELDTLAAAADGPAVVYTLTRSRPQGWTGYNRRIDRAMLAEVAWPAADRPLIFICGPTAMVEAAAAICVELGHPPERVLTERFGGTGGS